MDILALAIYTNITFLKVRTFLLLHLFRHCLTTTASDETARRAQICLHFLPRVRSLLWIQAGDGSGAFPSFTFVISADLTRFAVFGYTLWSATIVAQATLMLPVKPHTFREVSLVLYLLAQLTLVLLPTVFTFELADVIQRFG